MLHTEVPRASAIVQLVLPPDVLRLMPVYMFTVSAMLVCKEWCTLIEDTPDYICRQKIDAAVERAVNAADIAQIPASMYWFASWENQVRIPNIMLAGTDAIIVNNYRFSIQWTSIVVYSSGIIYTPTFHNYIKSTWGRRRAAIEEHYFYYIYEAFEQYRKFVGNHVSPRLYGVQRDTRYLVDNTTNGVSMRDYARQLWPKHSLNSTIAWHLNDDMRRFTHANPT